MAGRRKSVLDVREMLRRLRAGDSDRRIARELSVSRVTVKKYRKQAKEEGWLAKEEGWLAQEEGWLAQEELLAPAALGEALGAAVGSGVCGPPSGVEPYREFVKAKREEGVELQALLGLLREKGYVGSYSSLRRFAARLEKKRPAVYVRVETSPGEEAQVDFGYAGRLYEPTSERVRKAWVFVMNAGLQSPSVRGAGFRPEGGDVGGAACACAGIVRRCGQAGSAGQLEGWDRESGGSRPGGAAELSRAR